MTTPDSKLGGRTAIVTGGGSGIGKSIAVLLAKHGANVAILDLAGDNAAREITAGGDSALALTCDVTKQAEVVRAFGRAAKEFGTLDVLINSAGVAAVGNVEAATEEDLDRVYAVNVKGVYNCLRSGVTAMKERGGSIINIASVASSVGIPDRFAYSMSKGAVLTMTYSVAADYVSAGIRCNAISPARVHTPFVDGYLATHYPGREQEMFEKLSRTQPIGRMGEPWEVAEVALFLASDAATFITGSNFAVDGGFVSLKV
jgi:NAD(P)-dependent dehydrogenase (short-subunit alcohol dehydrogenase family)